MAQSQQRAQQRTGVGPLAQTRRALVLGFRPYCVRAHQSLTDAVLNAMQRLDVETLAQARQQFAERPRDRIKRAGGGLGDLRMRARRQQQKRNQQPGGPAERDLDHSIERRSERRCTRHRRNKQHDDGGDRRHRKSLIDRRDECKRRYGERENGKQRDFALVRNEHPDGPAPDGAAERADEVVERRHQRAPHAHLRDDDSGQYRPERQRQVQALRKHQRRNGGNRHPYGKRQLHPMPAQNDGKTSPHMCDAFHDEVPLQRSQ